jgi:hypothetical protein
MAEAFADHVRIRPLTLRARAKVGCSSNKSPYMIENRKRSPIRRKKEA